MPTKTRIGSEARFPENEVSCAEGVTPATNARPCEPRACQLMAESGPPETNWLVGGSTPVGVLAFIERKSGDRVVTRAEGRRSTASAPTRTDTVTADAVATRGEANLRSPRSNRRTSHRTARPASTSRMKTPRPTSPAMPTQMLPGEGTPVICARSACHHLPASSATVTVALPSSRATARALSSLRQSGWWRARRRSHPTSAPIPYPIAARTPPMSPWMRLDRGIRDGATLKAAATAAPMRPANENFTGRSARSCRRRS